MRREWGGSAATKCVDSLKEVVEVEVVVVEGGGNKAVRVMYVAHV